MFAVPEEGRHEGHNHGHRCDPQVPLGCDRTLVQAPADMGPPGHDHTRGGKRPRVLGFLDPEAAARLCEASTTITSQQGITTLRIEDLVPLVEAVYPEDEPASLEAQQTYVLIAQGDTTEEALAAAGSVLRVDGPLQ